MHPAHNMANVARARRLGCHDQCTMLAMSEAGCTMLAMSGAGCTMLVMSGAGCKMLAMSGAGCTMLPPHRCKGVRYAHVQVSCTLVRILHVSLTLVITAQVLSTLVTTAQVSCILLVIAKQVSCTPVGHNSVVHPAHNIAAIAHPHSTSTSHQYLTRLPHSP